MGILHGKRVLITGGAGGIGLEIAKNMAGEGASVIINDVRLEMLEHAVNMLQEQGWHVEGMQADITDEASVERMFENIKQKGKLDVLLNNAGLSIRGVRALRTGTIDHQIRKISEIHTEDWRGVLDLNLTGTFMCTRAAVPLLKNSTAGRIINISSKAGRAGGDVSDLAYVTSKAGLLGFTKQCAKELGPYGITSNAVAPGLVSTEWFKKHWESLGEERQNNILKDVPLQRPGESAEISKVCTFLASDGASYITGATIDVNGGWYFS